jgi:NAD(P)-dependent dehydrogenase (short-subunit alcohol dehydrogenase family)
MTSHGLMRSRPLKKGNAMELNGKVVVITGAASGIGREMARAFAHKGAKLAIADINEEGLLEVKEELTALADKVNSYVVDVAVAEEVKDFCDNVYRDMGRVDVLCNNAGVAVAGFLEDLTVEDWRWILGINLMGVIYGCHFFYPRMIEQGGGGHIVNTASAAGLIPASGTVAYSTSKFGVVGLSETLRAEAALHGIGVTAVCPGFVLTGIFQNARYKTVQEGMTAEDAVETAERLLKRRRATASTVAEKAVKAVEDNKGIVKIGMEAHIGDLARRLSRGVFGSIMIRMMKAGQKGQQNKSGKV